MMTPMADVPTGLVATREALHAVAERVVSPLRVQATGNEIALTPAPGGFGTLELPSGGRVSVSGTEIVAADGRRAELTSLRDAARHVGLRAADELPGEPLAIDPAAAGYLAELFAFAGDALDALAAEVDDPSPAYLWPEHFDVAIEGGDEAAGTRATYGASPGDEHHPEPYLYVGPWVAREGELWQATGFAGAEVAYREIAAAPDPREAALAFWRARRDALRGG
jgi:hypothetical protein